jgi:hypothetical protein
MQQIIDDTGNFVRRWQLPVRILVVVVLFGLGFWGWYLDNRPHDWRSWLENVYRTLQLLALQSPRGARGVGGGIDTITSWQLEVARIGLPLAVLFESYRFVLSAIRSPARIAMLGLRRGHILVVPGKGPTGMVLMQAVRRSGLRAVVVAADLRVEDRARIDQYELTILSGDPLREATWHQARADRADLVMVSQGSDVENLNIAVTVANVLHSYGGRPGPILVAALENELLAEQVDIALDNAARASGLRYRRLSVPEEAARAIFLEPPLPTRKKNRDVPSHIVVLGLGAGARAVLRHALMFGQDAGRAGPLISVLAAEKELAAEPLLRPDMIPAFVAELRGVPCEWSDGVPQVALDTLAQADPIPLLVCICLADDVGVSVGLALAREAALEGWPPFTIAVHQQREDRFLSLLAREETIAGHARLRPFGGLLPPETLRRLRDEREDALSRAVHEHYLETLRNASETSGTKESWADLKENVRHSNRASADHIAVKLAVIGCRPVAEPTPPFSFTEAEIDMLARIEHRRWCAERLLGGWRPGSRDNDRRLHPDLVPFDELTESGRDKDRDSVRAVPGILALVGLSIQRVAPLISDV